MTILYVAIIDAPLPVAYRCENGDKFILEVVNRGQFKMIMGTQEIVLTRETELDTSVAIYGNNSDALTFVSGHGIGMQVIKTARGEAPLSTVCNPF